MTIFPIPAFNDNYIWVILHPTSSRAIIVDPGDAAPVLKVLQQKHIQLDSVLLTHHHFDHTAGVKGLLEHYEIPVYGPKSISLVTHPLKEGDHLSIKTIDTTFTIMEIPGHTLDHIAYVSDGTLFCGDTLFAGGCGRVFEGTYPEMYASLQKIAALPPETLIYCAHEYTVANLTFAQIVEPENPNIQKRILDAAKLRSEGIPTIPTPLALELSTNPFLRCEQNSVQRAASAHSQQNLTNPVDVFAEIRSWKDQF